MRSGEGLVEIQVDNIESDISRTNDTDNRIQVGTVVVAETAGFVNETGDLQDVFVEKTYCIRVCQHQTCCLRSQVSLQVIQVNHSLFVGFDYYYIVACHCSTGWVCAVGGVRDDNLLSALVSSAFVISLDEKESCELTLCTGCRLECHVVHSCNLAEGFSQSVYHLCAALYSICRLERMDSGESRKRSHNLVDSRVVLHGAGAQRIESVVYTS